MKTKFVGFAGGSMLLLGACSSPAVRCDAHLMPINAPAPIHAAGAPTAPAADAPPSEQPAPSQGAPR